MNKVCGITGELRFDGAAADRQLVAAMAERLAHRGPDDSGLHSDGPVALGHRRLSVIDLSARAHQPMLDAASGCAIVFNGAIYNYPQLRETLIALGHRFTSSGDTEVILRAYLQWGSGCVARFNGMFAFAIWDARERSLFMARDRMGIKPLYYSHGNKALRFASSLTALLAAEDIDRSIDPAGLHHQFTLHGVVPAPRTLLKGVRKLRPAHWRRVHLDGRVEEQCYWQLSARRGVARSEREWTEAVHDALRLAVKRRLDIADVPVGVLLSGGLDSSLLVGLLAEAGVGDLKTFTVGFEDQPEEKGSEFEYSDPVAERFATEHHKFHVPDEQLISRLPEAIEKMAEPMFGQDAVAFYLLSERVSKEVKVVQSGQGADEVFAGYFWYPQMHAAQKAAGNRETMLETFASRYFDRSHAEWLEAVDPAHHSGDATAELIAELLAGQDADEYLDRVLAMDVTTLIVDDPVKRVDNMTMAWGLEARVPFLDHELVELAMQLPTELKLREGGKGPLKAIARGLLPDSVIDRSKGYFPVPALKFVRGEVLDFMRDIVNSKACRERGLYGRGYIERLLAAPDAEENFTRLRGSKLWHAALLELWLQTHL